MFGCGFSKEVGVSFQNIGTPKDMNDGSLLTESNYGEVAGNPYAALAEKREEPSKGWQIKADESGGPLLFALKNRAAFFLLDPAHF